MSTTMSKNRVRDFLPSNWNEIEGVMEQILGPAGLRASTGYFVPASLWEDGDAYHVEVDVPGVDRDKIDLKFENGALTITVERGVVDQQRRCFVEERRFGRAARTVALPESIDPESIQASLADGVLHVTMTKKPEAQSKQIEIR